MDSTTQLHIINRKLSDQALTLLIKNENCTPVTLDCVRPDISFRRAVAVVLSSRGKNDRSGGGALYYVTDMKGHIAKLYMSANARSGFGSKNDEGALVILLNPVITSNSDRGYTLIFSVERQQDIVLVGNCSTFGRCSGIRKDGKPCSMPVDTSATSRCPHHPEGRIASSSSFCFISQEEHDRCQQQNQHIGKTLNTSFPTAQSGSTDSSHTALPPAPDAFERALSSAPSGPTANSLAPPPPIPRRSAITSAGYTSTKDIDTEEITDTVMHAVTVPPKDLRVNGSVHVPQQSTVFSAASRAAALHQRKGPENTIQQPSPHNALSRGIIGAPSAVTNSLLAKPSTSSYRPLANPSSSSDPWKTSASTLRRFTPTSTAPPDELQVLGCGGAHAVLLNVSNLCRNGAAAAAAAKTNGPGIRPLDMVFGAMKKKSVDCIGKQTSGGSLKRKTSPNPTLANKVSRTGGSVGAGGVSSSKLEALLNRESAHAEEASSEWFEGFQNRMSHLEKQEEKALKDETITSISVRGSQCLTCGALTEYPLEICKRQGHMLQTVSAIKRFYECERCGRRDSTIGSKHLPQHRCPKCNEYKWVVCGKNRSGYIVGSRDRDSDNRLIVSLSADSSRSDISKAVGMASSLDYTAR